MRPVSPNTGADEIQLAKDQPEYFELPAAVYHNSALNSPEIVTRWTLTDAERLAIAEGADIFVSQTTFGELFRPINVQVGPQHYQLKHDAIPGSEFPK
jgi:hypothetical protein